MNINRINFLAETYHSNVRKTGQTAKKPGMKRDEISISSEGKLLDLAKKTAAALPDIREDRVAQLAKKIEGGGYRVNAAKVAKLLTD